MAEKPTINEMQNALLKAAAQFRVVLAERREFGWRHKSIGSQAEDENRRLFWLRVTYTQGHHIQNRVSCGYRDAQVIQGVRKPVVINLTEWIDADYSWQAELLSYVAEPLCSPFSYLSNRIDLEPEWWINLQNSLDNLARVDTTRVCVRQDLVTRRLQERYGTEIDPTIGTWVVSHGDLHWSNLTRETCWILDWEGWGNAPLGTDAAFLLCFSCLRPETVATIRKAFGTVLETPDGQRAQLFACAELLRMIELYGDHPILERPLIDLGRAVFENLKRSIRG